MKYLLGDSVWVRSYDKEQGAAKIVIVLPNDTYILHFDKNHGISTNDDQPRSGDDLELVARKMTLAERKRMNRL